MKAKGPGATAKPLGASAEAKSQHGEKMKFTDMHCHIIYGVDDGARTPEDMHGMLRLAAENGIDHIVCTSHITPGEAEFPARKYLEHLQEGQRYCDEQGLGIQMHLGSEILWTDMSPRMVHEGKVPTLDRSWCVLVEFWWDVEYSVMLKAARELGNEGMTVIFAHIERYKPLRSIERLRVLAEEYKVLLQMNGSTVIESGDHIVVAAPAGMLKDVNDIMGGER